MTRWHWQLERMRRTAIGVLEWILIGFSVGIVVSTVFFIAWSMMAVITWIVE